MMETRLMVTRRLAPATSAPPVKASFTTARKAKRNSATANEPSVRSSRTFLRKRLAKMSRAEFHAAPPASDVLARLRRLHQHAFFQMEHHVRARRNQGVVRDHQHGLVVLAHQLLDQRHDFVGALAVEVAGGLVAEQKRGIGDDGAGNGHALLLSAGELAGKMARRGRAAPRWRARSPRARGAGIGRACVSSSGSSTFWYAVSTGTRLYI